MVSIQALWNRCAEFRINLQRQSWTTTICKSSDDEYIENVSTNVRQKLNRPEGDRMLDQRVNVSIWRLFKSTTMKGLIDVGENLQREGRSLFGQFEKSTRERITILVDKVWRHDPLSSSVSWLHWKSRKPWRRQKFIFKDSHVTIISENSTQGRLTERVTHNYQAARDRLVQGVPQHVVLEDRERMTQIRELMKSFRTKYRTESIITDLRNTEEFNRFSEKSKKTIQKLTKIAFDLKKKSAHHAPSTDPEVL